MENTRKKTSAYKNFIITMFLSFTVMYAVMFMNVFDTSHIYTSINRFYMALLMVAPMAVIMISMMRMMYTNKKLNRIIISIAIGVFFLAFAGLRSQAFIGDRQYMKGMIPHHSSAILTSTQAHIKDPAVRKLADGIVASQEREIAEMKALVEQMEKGVPEKISSQNGAR